MVVSSLPASYAFGLVTAGAASGAVAAAGRTTTAHLARCSSRLSTSSTHRRCAGGPSTLGAFDRSRRAAFGVAPAAAAPATATAMGADLLPAARRHTGGIGTRSRSDRAVLPLRASVSGRSSCGGRNAGSRGRSGALFSTSTSDVPPADASAAPSAAADAVDGKAAQGKKGGGGNNKGNKGGKAGGGGGKKKGGAPAEDTPVAELRAVRGWRICVDLLVPTTRLCLQLVSAADACCSKQSSYPAVCCPAVVQRSGTSRSVFNIYSRQEYRVSIFVVSSTSRLRRSFWLLRVGCSSAFADSQDRRFLVATCRRFGVLCFISGLLCISSVIAETTVSPSLFLPHSPDPHWEGGGDSRGGG